MNAFFACGFQTKSVAVPFFSPDVEWSLPPSLSLPALSPPVSPVVVADPNVFGTTLKFLFGKKKTKQQNTHKKKRL